MSPANDLYIDLNTFLNRFEFRPNGAYAFFLGSGTSIQSGIPTGNQLVWDFKRRIYCDHHKIKNEKFNDLGSSESQKTLQDFLITQSIIPSNLSDEYSFYFEKCFPTKEDRKHYIQAKVANAVPSIGHKCLGKLFVEGVVDRIFTTNFDELVEAGIQQIKSGHSFIVISPEKDDRISELDNTNYSKVIKLHGDYRYDSLKNASSELKNLDTNLSAYFKKTLQNKGLFVIGYSGNDESIISELESIVSSNDSLTHGLVWCHRVGEMPNDRLKSLITLARSKNEHSGFIAVDNFDETAYLLYTKKCKKDESIEKESKNLVTKKQPFQLDQSPSNIPPFILNAIDISSFPTTAWAVDSNGLKWSDLRAVESRENIVFSIYRKKIFLWGDKAEINNFLSHLNINQTPTSIDLYKTKLMEESSHYQGMIYDAILLHFKKKGFETYKAGLYSLADTIQDRSIPSNYFAYEALKIQLFWAEDKLRLLLVPTIYMKGPHTDGRNDSTITVLVNKLKSVRFNGQTGELLKVWKKKLFQNPTEKISIGEFSFTLLTNFAFAGYPQTNKTHFFKRTKFFEEPKIIFSQLDSSKTTIHPLKGLNEFAPYEHNLGGKTTPIRLAVITSDSAFDEVKRHLDSLNSETSNSKPDELYLINYPGFSKVYRSTLDVPLASDQTRVLLIKNQDSITKNYLEFYDMLKACILAP